MPQARREPKQVWCARWAGLAGPARVLGLLLLPTVLVAQTPGPNRNVVSGVVDSSDPAAVVKTDVFRQRQNEPVMAPSSTNPEHLLAAANDYRTIDIAGDQGTGERDDGLLARALARVVAFFQKVLGIEPEPTPEPKANADAWIGVYRSCDRGRTWIGSLLPGSPTDGSPASLESPLYGLTTASDPVMAPAPDGRAFLGGLGFTRGGTSAIFVARYTDRNDREGGACFTYDFTRVAEAGSASETGRFADKPTIAADVARSWGNVSKRYTYMAYTIFTGLETDTNFRGRVRFVRSEDDGETWSRPVTVSGNYIHNQGAALAIDPVDGDVYLVWRDFIDDRILMTRSHDFGVKWSDPVSLTGDPIAAFDQVTGPDQFRSNGFPTIAVDGAGTVFVAWQERVNVLGEPDPFGDPRIVLTRSEEISNQGVVWSPRHVVDPGNGPQVMPALSAHAGQLMLLYAEAAGEPPILTGRDARLDVRVAELDPATGLLLHGASVPVSEYTLEYDDELTRLIEISPGYPAYHRPNLPMFRGGTVPFIGDYKWLAAAQPYVRTEEGGWRWASQPGDVAAPSFHAIWTDNRNVRLPEDRMDGPWGEYAPPGTGASSCVNAGSRNQDVFTSEISNGLVAGSPSLFKPLVRPNGESIQRAFVVYVANRTAESKFVLLNLVPEPDTNTTASFYQFDSTQTFLPDDDPFEDSMEILPHSTLTQTVYVESTTADATVDFEVWDALGENVLARVVLNESPSSFGLTNTNISDSETHTPRISNPRISNPRISNPRISNPRISNWTVNNPRISNPRISNPRISNETLEAGWETRDVTYTMVNAGNTTTVYDLQTYIPDEYLTEDSPYEFQLIVYKTVSTIGADVVGNTCVPVEILHDEFISNVATPRISNPRISNPRISNPRISNPRISNPRISNTSFYLEPAEGPVAVSQAGAPETQSLAAERAMTFEAVTAEAATTSADTGDLSAPLPVPQVHWTLRIYQLREVAEGEPSLAELAPGPEDPPGDPLVSAAVVSQSTNVIDGVPEEDPPYVLVGPEPPVPEKNVDGDKVPIANPPAAATGLAFSQQPTSTQVGHTMPPVEVRLVDSSGATVPVTGIPVTLELSANPGVLSGALVQLTDSGLATFDDLSVSVAADGYALLATAPDLADATSAPFDVTVDRPIVPPLMTRVSVDSTENQGAGPGEGCAGGRSITPDGRFLAFDCTFTNLVPGDTNDARDVFVRDRQDGTTTRVSVTSLGDEADGDSFFSSLSDDGRFVAFESTTTNLDTASPDANAVSDVFVHDRQTGQTTRVSVGPAVEANGASTFPVISGDGRTVAFWSDATNLVADDTNDEPDVFVVELATLSTFRVSVKSGGDQANSGEGHALPAAPAISADGRIVAFQSIRADLADQGKLGWRDIYVHDRNTTTTTRVSVASDGTEGTIPKGCGPWDGPEGKFACADFASSNPSLSADGRHVAFDSIYDNLVPDDTNFDGLYLGRDVFVHDRQTGETTRVSVSTEGAQDDTFSGTGVPCGVGPNAPALSPDGRFVTFSSCGSSLVASDTNGISDAFLHDRSLGTAIRTSTYSGGAEVTTSTGAFGTRFTAASQGAQYLAMGSDVETLVDGDTNRNVPTGELGGDIFVSEPIPAPAPPAERFLVFTVQPADTPERDPITPAIQVEIQDAAGNTDLTAADLVALSVDSGLGTLQGMTTVNAVAGVAVFQGLSLTEEGPHTLRANAVGLLGVVSSPFTVLPPTATQLGFVVQPVDTEAGATMAPVHVAIHDDSGTTVVTRTDTVTLTLLGSGAGILSGTTTVDAVDGVAVFDDLSIDVAAEGYSLEATAVGLDDDTSIAFDVGPSPVPLTLVVTSTADSGRGSLRQAILAANANMGRLDAIQFGIEGAGPQTITPASALPVIVDPVSIDGSTQAGYDGVPLVQIDGSGAGAGVDGLRIETSDTTIRAMMITSVTSVGVRLVNATNTRVESSYVGTDGTRDLGNGVDGIAIQWGSGNRVDRCVVSGNGSSGVILLSTTDAEVTRSMIGTTADGLVGIGNDTDGVHIRSASDIRVGTGAAGAGNTIAGNGQYGINMGGIGAITGILVAGNRIGTDTLGVTEIPNDRGINISGPDVADVTIGGTTSDSRNIISGNTKDGISLSESQRVSIFGNYIGVAVDGQALGNGWRGVIAGNTTATSIGSASSGNVISANRFEGLYVYGTGPEPVVVHGNLIGTDPTGTLSRRNVGGGIEIADSPHNRIGGSGSGEGNVIANALTTGIYVRGPGATGNIIEGNRIGTNGAGDAALGPQFVGIEVNAGPSDTVIRGNVISGQGPGGGVRLVSDSSNSVEGTLVQGNYIGTDATGTVTVPNEGNGVALLEWLTTGNTLRENVISGNTGSGVLIKWCSLNELLGNKIGTDVTGTTALGNDIGVRVSTAYGNAVGKPGNGNLISGNRVGVHLSATSDGNVVQGNLIGTTTAGNEVLANTDAGVHLTFTSGDLIGGMASSEGNVVSGNGNCGIELASATTDAEVRGNRIGTNADGNAAVPNSRCGVEIWDSQSSGNTIADNTIAGNEGHGVLIRSAAHHNTVVRNLIGSVPGGPLGNAPGGGVLIGLDAHDNTIGGADPADGNTIANNGVGVAVRDDAGIGNGILSNSIVDNVGLGIDLWIDGVTENDPLDTDGGPNNSQNYPVIESAVADLGAGTTDVAVSLESTPDSSFAVEFFYGAICDPSGFGEGETYLGTTSLLTDGSGQATSAATLPGVVPFGFFVTATARAPDGSTSEFSACQVSSTAPAKLAFVEQPTDTAATATISPSVQVAIQDAEGRTLPEAAGSITLVASGGAGLLLGTTTVDAVDGIATFDDLSIEVVGTGYTLTATATGLEDATSSPFDVLGSATPLALWVTTAADSGQGSLRQALVAANANGGTQDVVGFAIPGSGLQTIVLSSALPVIADPIVLDGTTQGGYVGTPLVRLDGALLSDGNGLAIQASSSTVRGLIVTGFPGAGVLLNGVAGTTIEDSFIGTDGTSAIGNNGGGIFVSGGGTNGIRGNVIAGNNHSGVSIAGSSGNTIEANHIGTNVADSAAIGNQGNGITVNGESGVTSGNTIRSNVVSGNLASGIAIGNVATDTVVVGNKIGTNNAGTAALPNGEKGLIVNDGSNDPVIGQPGLGNLISGNGQAGLTIAASSGATVQGNLIGTNAGATGAIPNGGHGVFLTMAGAVIGGGGVGEGNVISGNTGDGLALFDVMGAFVAGNWIGTNASGADLGNGGSGVILSGAVMTNSIGGLGSEHGNTIAFNTGHGVWDQPGPSGTAILGNSIHSNGLLGIFDNGQLPAPSITSVETSGGSTTIVGGMPSFPDNPAAGFRVEFFWSTSCDPSGSGEGETFLGRTEVDSGASFSVSFGAVSGGVITATAAWSPVGTSGFSFCRENAAAPGRIEVTKVVDLGGAAPQGDEQFEICLTGPDPSPDVVCQTTGVAGGTLSFDGLAVGQYVVSETDPGPEWSVAVDPAGGVVSVPAGGVGVATVTNSLQTGNIVVSKATDPAGDPTDFYFTASWDPDGFWLRDGGTEDSGPLAPGMYSVEEAPMPGWTASAVCSDGQDPLSINLAGGQVVTCAFTNTPEYTANIAVTKVVDLGGALYQGDEQFEICLTGPDPFPDMVCQTIPQVGPVIFDGLAAGQYIVSETDPGPEWMVTIEPAGGVVSVSAGGADAATVTNRLLTGNIIVSKATDSPGDPTSFSFVASWDAGGFTLSDGGSIDSGPLAPGTYSVDEVPVTGWSTSVICSNMQNPLSIQLDSGQTVTCTFTNTLVPIIPGQIQVTKTVDWGTVPPTTPPLFEICIWGPMAEPSLSCQLATVAPGNVADVTWEVLPGTYEVRETDPGPEWGTVIDPGIVEVLPGQTVYSSVVNARLP